MTELDLTPQRPRPAESRSWRNWIIMGLLAVAAGFVLYQALTSARVFFLNVDEAVAQRSSLGDDTFQIQGTVVTEPEVGEGGLLVFTISYGGQDAMVRHVGAEPSSLFRLGQPVVAEGRWDGEAFQSTQILVKHSEEYVEDNPSRVDYELDNAVPEAG